MSDRAIGGAQVELGGLAYRLKLGAGSAGVVGE